MSIQISTTTSANNKKPATTNKGGVSGFGGFGDKPTNSAKKEIPPEIAKKTVKHVLEDFEEQLEKQVKDFNTQVKQVQRIDTMIYKCLDSLKHLESQIKTVRSSYDELWKNADALIKEQDAFLKELKKKQDPIVASSDQRQRLYTTAHKLGKQFHEMETELTRIIDSAETVTKTNDFSDINSITSIANCHLDSMRWLEHQSALVEDKIMAISRHLPTDN